ncbi:MAG: 2Fe-2S iron-sulfur cluster binding domain-containing protein [bacterium]|nr:2Fe-2S iron-sulfur cluster binding domain-containing protein [bacterium]
MPDRRVPVRCRRAVLPGAVGGSGAVPHLHERDRRVEQRRSDPSVPDTRLRAGQADPGEPDPPPAPPRPGTGGVGAIRPSLLVNVPAALVLEALAGYSFRPASCEQGACGTCIATILDGEPDHRDVYLHDSERAAEDRLLTCVGTCPHRRPTRPNRRGQVCSRGTPGRSGFRAGIGGVGVFSVGGVCVGVCGRGIAW